MIARQDTIDYENRKLLNKMIVIDTKPGRLNPYEIQKRSFTPTKSLHITQKMREWQRINEENKVGLIRPVRWLIPSKRR